MQQSKRRPIHRVLATAVGGAALAAAQLALAMPANDDCANATAIAALPFVDVLDTSMAGTGVDDQAHSCTGALDSNSVWYEYVVPANETLDLDLLGTPYEAVIAVYDACGVAANEIACFHDDSGSIETRAPLSVRAGNTVYLQVTDVGGAGGVMTFNVNNDPKFKVGTVKTIQQVAGSSTPNPSGGVIGTIHSSTILSGRVAAYAATTHGIYQRTAGGLSNIAASGMATPIGGVFRKFGPPVTQNAASVAFYAGIDGVPGVREGIFSWNGAVLAAVAVEGDPTPAGGTYRGFEEFIAMNGLGDIAFAARIDTNPNDGLFAVVGGVPSLVALEDDASPCGGFFRSFSSNRGGVAINAAGDVAFRADDTLGEGMHLWQGGVVTAYACEGGAPPATGGVYRSFGEHIDMNVGADAIFMAVVDNGSILDAIFAGPTAGLTLLAVEGGAIGFTNFTGFRDNILPSINDARQSAYVARLAFPGDAIVGAVNFVAAPTVILAENGACPFGGSISAFGEEVDLNLLGDVTAEVACTSGRGVIRGNGGVFSGVGNTFDATALGTGWRFSDGQTDAAGDVVVSSKRTAIYGGRCGGGGCTPPILMAKSPMPLAGAAAANIETIDPYSVNGSKEAVFTAVASGGGVRTELILRGRPGGPLTKVVEVGDPLPVAVGTFAGFSDSDPFGGNTGLWRAASQGRKVAFAASVSSGSYDRGIFQAKGAVMATLAYNGMVAPSGETLEEFSSPSISGNKVVFAAETSIGDCIYRSIKPTLPLNTVICVGDPAPASVGGSIDDIIAPPTIAGRTVRFLATVAGGAASECVFGDDGTVFDAIVCEGAPLPGGGTLDSGASGSVGTNPGSQGKGVIFAGRNLDDEQAVLVYRKDTFYTVAMSNRTAVGGNLISLWNPYTAIKGKTVVFGGSLAGANDSTTLFLSRLK